MFNECKGFYLFFGNYCSKKQAACGEGKKRIRTIVEVFLDVPLSTKSV
jgi:hypothetical protein